jgi:hypothetical protein
MPQLVGVLVIPVVHVALVSAYPTEDDAREAFSGINLARYRGIWIHPTPEAPAVHVFSDADETEIADAGWTRPETQEA